MTTTHTLIHVPTDARRLWQEVVSSWVGLIAVFGLLPFLLISTWRLVRRLSGMTPGHPGFGVVWLLILSVLATALTLVVVVWAIWSTTRIPTRPVQSLCVAAIAATVWAATTLVWSPPRSRVVMVGAAVVSYLALAIGASFLGKLIAAGFKDQNLVLPAAVAAALVDYWGVYFGTTRQIVTQHHNLVHKVSVHIPSLAPGLGLDIGPGDFVFLGIIFALLHRFDLKPARTAMVMACLLAIAAVIPMVSPLSVPGVVPMGLAVLIVNGRSFKYERSELFALLYAAVMLGVGAAAWWLFHRGHAH